MKSEELTLEESVNEELDMISTDELITDFSFFYKIRQMNKAHDVDFDNYGFCMES